MTSMNDCNRCTYTHTHTDRQTDINTETHKNRQVHSYRQNLANLPKKQNAKSKSKICPKSRLFSSAWTALCRCIKKLKLLNGIDASMQFINDRRQTFY